MNKIENNPPLVIKNKSGYNILSVLENGDIVLRGTVIANDKELSNVLTEVGKALEGVYRILKNTNTIDNE